MWMRKARRTDPDDVHAAKFRAGGWGLGRWVRCDMTFRLGTHTSLTRWTCFVRVSHSPLDTLHERLRTAERAMQSRFNPTKP